MPTPLSPTLLRTVGGSLPDIPLHTVERLAEYHAKIIRKLPREVAVVAVGDALNDICRSYSRTMPTPEAMQKMVKMVGRDFAYLAPDEIQEAYRLWAAKKLQVDGGELYGQITPQQLGAVLDAYSHQHRKYLYGPFLSAIEGAKQAEAREAAEQAKREAFEAEWPDRLAELVETAEDWRDVPEYFYHVLRDRGELDIDKKAAHLIYEDAAQLVIIEENARIREKQQRGRIFEKLPPRENMQKVIARKLTVFRLYIIPHQQKEQ